MDNMGKEVHREKILREVTRKNGAHGKNSHYEYSQEQK